MQSTDNSVQVVTSNNYTNFNLVNAGQNWSTFNASSEVNMNENSLSNLSNIGFSSFGSNNPLVIFQSFSGYTGSQGLYITDNYGINGANSGKIYDSLYNRPTLASVLMNNGNSAGGYNILNVNHLQCQTINGIIPSSGGSVVSSLAYTLTDTLNIAPLTNTIVQWNGGVDNANSVGAGFLLVNAEESFVNSTSNTIIINVSAYVTWTSGSSLTSLRYLWIVKNYNPSTNNNINTDRYGYSTSPMAQSNNSSTSLCCNLVLAPNDFFSVYVYHDDATDSTVSIGGNSYPPARIMITRLL